MTDSLPLSSLSGPDPAQEKPSVIRDVRTLNPRFGRAGLSVIGPYRKLFSRFRDNSDWYIQESTGVIFRIGRVNGAKIDLSRESYVKQIKIWNGMLPPDPEPEMSDENV